MKITLPITIALVFITSVALGQPSESKKAENLRTCLSGQLPSLCRKEWLTSEQLAQAKAAEKAANLRTCLSGQFPTLCKKSLLSPEELSQVKAAEKRENLRTCMTGQFKSLCKKDMLSKSELHQVLEAEKAANIKTCLSGYYPTLCDRSLLTAEQLQKTKIAEEQAKKTATSVAKNRAGYRPRSGYSRGGCESGHWIDSVSSDGSVIKLEDGSVWQVDPIDTIDSSLWLPISDIVVCDDKLINTDDNESVGAIRIQ